MKLRLIALVLALMVTSWAQTTTQTSQAPDQGSAGKKVCACCDKGASAEAKAGDSCCAHHQAAKDGKLPECCGGKDKASCCNNKESMACDRSKGKGAVACSGAKCGNGCKDCGKSCRKSCEKAEKTASNYRINDPELHPFASSGK